MNAAPEIVLDGLQGLSRALSDARVAVQQHRPVAPLDVATARATLDAAEALLLERRVAVLESCGRRVRNLAIGISQVTSGVTVDVGSLISELRQVRELLDVLAASDVGRSDRAA